MKDYQYILTYGATVETLGFNPAGYDKLGITFMRHEFYHSVLRTFTLSLRFVNLSRSGLTGGYQLIKQAYDTDGIYAEVEIEIKKRNPNTNDYDSLYTGVLDFTPGRWTIDRDLFFEIAINDSSVLQKFISRDENEINLYSTKTIDNITITPPTPIDVNLTPVDIVLKYQAETLINQIMPPAVGENRWYFKYPIINIGETDNFDLNDTETIYTNNDISDKIVKIDIQFNYNWSVQGPGTSYNFGYVTKHIRGGVSIATNTEVLVSGIAEMTYTGSNRILWTLANVIPNDSLEVYFFYFLAGTPARTITIIDTHSHFSTEITTGEPESTAKCLKAFTALNTALAINTNQVDALDADVMESGGDLENDMVLNGFQIRKYPAPKVDVKFRDLFKSFDAIANLGLWYDKSINKFILKEKAYFFDSNTKLFTLDSVSKFKIQPLASAYFSKIEAGFDNTGGYEKAQGAYEPAVKREYSTGAKVKESKNIQAPYRFDSVGIEDLRIKQFRRVAGEDSDDDTAIFIVRTEDNSGYYPIMPDVGSPEYLGMDVFYSYYNTMLTPRQNALRWGNVLKACAYHNTNPIQAQKTEKQFDLEIDGVDENSNIEISELGEALFIPELYIFESYLTPANLQTLLSNPHGYIDVPYNGHVYSGFVHEIELTDNNRKANFKLIAMDNTLVYRIFEDEDMHTFEDGTQKISE